MAWSGRHDSYLKQAVLAVAEEVQRKRSRERAKAAEISKKLVRESREIAHETEFAELERLAVLGQVPQSEYKARMAALHAKDDE
ncbi:hypothetical protein ACFV3R_02775 [Streptomyces sp. NPDC059740]|uniref:hypothetical protein n=1 Tax=Streptomyces sp. NPDC059740 TaxID=3346926 RepID=UPI003667C0C4